MAFYLVIIVINLTPPLKYQARGEPLAFIIMTIKDRDYLPILTYASNGLVNDIQWTELKKRAREMEQSAKEGNFLGIGI